MSTTERGTTTERGYGADHQRRRAQVKRDVVDPGLAYCWRCGEWINPALPWDLGHDDFDRSIVRGPEHRGRECKAGGNRATSRRDRRRAQSTPHSREW